MSLGTGKPGHKAEKNDDSTNEVVVMESGSSSLTLIVITRSVGAFGSGLPMVI